jgi:hypothetical protein
MATYVCTLDPDTYYTLKPEDHSLLRWALESWNDKATFTDEHVAQVKQRAFQRWLVESAWARQHDRVKCVLCMHDV